MFSRITIFVPLTALTLMLGCSATADVGEPVTPTDSSATGTPNDTKDDGVESDGPAKGDPPPNGPAPPAGRRALVYRGPVVGCDGCSEAIADVLTKSKWNLDVKFVGPNEELKLSSEALSTAIVYAQPGGDGDVGDAGRLVEKQLGGMKVLSDWVKAGGRYYGTCMGGYLAAPGDESYPRISDKPWANFALLPGKSAEWIESPKASVKNDADTVVELVWRGKSRWVYFQDGPHFLLDANANATVLATYKSNGLPAAVVAPFGKGKVAVVGPHPEADDTWFDDADLTDPSGSKEHALDLAQDLVDTMME